MEMMEILQLKHRPSFTNNYLNPAINSGFVTMEFPDNPNNKTKNTV